MRIEVLTKSACEPITARRRTISGTLARLSLLPVVLLSVACGEDESVQPSGGKAGTGGSGGSGATGGSGGSDAGLPPLFGDAVPVTETLPTDGVSAPVDIVRDKFGTVHIFARSVEDALFAQGWMMSVDRHGQLELLRRFASGRIAEVFGGFDPSQIDDDITMRSLGLHRTAEKIYAAMPAGSLAKRSIDAFARGVSAWNAGIGTTTTLSTEYPGLSREHFTEWRPQDSIAMGRIQSWNLSYDADTEIGFTERWNAALATFNATASDPLLKKRAGYLQDMFRFAPIVPKTPITGYPGPSAKLLPAQAALRARLPNRAPQNARAAKAKAGPVPVDIAPETLALAARFAERVRRIKSKMGYAEFSGSNNWAVAGTHTESGNAMMANDPHLDLVSPMIFWPCHIVVDDPSKSDENLDVSGIAFAGIPGVILGATRNVAWGATTAGYDVSDAYREKVSADGQGVVYKGQTVPFQKISETIKIGATDEYTFDVLIVPHHGPIFQSIDADHKVVPLTAGGEALSGRWTGDEPSTELEAITDLYRAENVDEARTALEKFGVGGQNWMLADTNGDIAWSSHILFPYRDPRALSFDPSDYTGIFPGLILDGSSGDYEWIPGEFLENEHIPQDKNPASGYIATANGDNVGATLDNNPTNETLPNGKQFYVGYDFDEGWRVGRIYDRLEAATTVGKKMTKEEMASIQADVHYGLAARVSAPLITALEHALAEDATAGTHAELAAVVADARFAATNLTDVIDTLKTWGTEEFDYEAMSGVNPDDNTAVTDPKEATAAKATLIFSAWVVRALANTFEDEARKLGRQNIGTAFTMKAFIRCLEEPPSTLATYDPVTKESALWDDLDTPAVERKDAILARSMLDAIEDLTTLYGADRTKWRWGLAHTITFDNINPIWPFQNPVTNQPSSLKPKDPVFTSGFPRHGGQDAVDASNFGIMRGKADAFDFSYGGGPVQRFVAEMAPSGPILRNALPGGAIADTKSPHFKDDAERWRRNENRIVPVSIQEIVDNYQAPDEHIRMTPAK